MEIKDKITKVFRSSVDTSSNKYLMVPIFIFFSLLIFAMIRSPIIISQSGIGSAIILSAPLILTTYALTFNDDMPLKNEKEFTRTNVKYTSNDENAFDQIIKSSSNKKNYKEQHINIKVDKAKIKIIDFNKLNEREKNLKNKVGIEKIKIVYFD